MADERDDEERLPEVPPVPELPATPELKPDLPPRPKPPAHEDEEAGQYRRMGLAYTLPIALAAPIVLLTVLGYWLDERFRLSPWCTMGGALLGFIVGMVNMVRIAGRLNG